MPQSRMNVIDEDGIKHAVLVDETLHKPVKGSSKEIKTFSLEETGEVLFADATECEWRGTQTGRRFTLA